MRRFAACLLSLCLVLTGCASREITGRGTLDPSRVGKASESSAHVRVLSASESVPASPDDDEPIVIELPEADSSEPSSAPAEQPAAESKQPEPEQEPPAESEEPSNDTPSAEEPSSLTASASHETVTVEAPPAQAPAEEPIVVEEPSSQEPSSEEPAETITVEAPPSSEEPSSEEPAETITVEDPVSEEPSSEEPAETIEVTENPMPQHAAPASGEVRGVWISYLEFLNIAKGRTSGQFTSSISAMFDEAASYGLNTVFVQVRPFGDALYPSSIFPWSYVMSGTEGIDPGYDPLAIMVTAAHNRGLRIEAWVNPYRVRAESSTRALSAQNPAVRAVNSGDRLALTYKNGVFYNPASQDARDLITEGVVEILRNYAVDGIHFDDYFYPTTDTAFDAVDYAEYVNAGGRLALADWRRENVNKLLRQVNAAVSSYNAVFGVSPQARMDVNYATQYADIRAWVNEGIVDYLCPQIYFGFSHATQPFAARAEEWQSVIGGSGVDLYIGLAAYKCGITDNYAGDGRNEWVSGSNVLAHMVSYSRGLNGYAGFVLYRYDSFFAPDLSLRTHMANERSNLSDLL